MRSICGFYIDWSLKKCACNVEFFFFSPQNASAWHCFSFSKSPVTMTSDGSLHSGGNLTSISVINHVMHSSCGDVSVYNHSKHDTNLNWILAMLQWAVFKLFFLFLLTESRQLYGVGSLYRTSEIQCKIRYWYVVVMMMTVVFPACVQIWTKTFRIGCTWNNCHVMQVN